MRRKLLIPILLLTAFSGCASTEMLDAFEAEDLISLQHNDYNNCLLMVYQDPLGQTTHVLRRNGVTEVVIMYTIEGDITLKMRGEKERKIEVIEASHITQRINILLKAGEKEVGSIASI